MADGVRGDFFQASIPVGRNVFPLDRGDRSIRQRGSLPNPDPHGFLGGPFFFGDHFPLIAVQGLGEGRVFGFLPGDEDPGEKTPRSISDSVILAQASASAFVSKVLKSRGGGSFFLDDDRPGSGPFSEICHDDLRTKLYQGVMRA